MSKRAFLAIAMLLVMGATSVSAQRDTLFYDDGIPAWVWPFDTLLYWAVRFTPPNPCSVVAGQIYPQTPMMPGYQCTLFVWADAGGLPGSVVYDTLFSMFPPMQYAECPVSPYWTGANDFWIGYSTQNVPGVGRCWAQSDANLDEPFRSYVSYDRTLWSRCGDEFPMYDGDLLIRGVVVYPQYTHDVGASVVLEPPDVVACKDTVPVAAEVCNYGDTVQTFDVEVIIDSSLIVVWGDTVTVGPLDGGLCDTATFADWVVPDVHWVSYTVTVTTLLATDTDPTNDSAFKTVLGWCPAIHDVGTSMVLEPPDTVACGDSVPVAAEVCNYGDTVETFDVEVIIDSSLVVVWGDTVTVGPLDGGLCDTAIFSDWPVPDVDGVVYTVTVTTMLLTDIDPTNDTATKGTLGWCPAIHDVGAELVVEPPDTVACEDSVPVAARVCNYGDTLETFDVEALLDGVYGDTITVVDLTPGICDTFWFDDWVVPPVHGASYTVTVATLLGDTNPGNDTTWKTTLAWCPAIHDVGTDVVLQPPDTVGCGATVPVAARVCNYGDTAETFDVEALIDSGGPPIVYAETLTVVDLGTLECDTVTFPSWDVPPAHGVSYTVTVTTLLSGDSNPANDTAASATVGWCPPGHDVGTEVVLQPPDTVACESMALVVARVCNYGDTAETFDVEALIDSGGPPIVYAETLTVVGLDTLECDTLTFPGWVVPPAHGILYTVTVTTLLPDANPGNNMASKTALSWCPANHDVGTEVVLQPPDTVECQSMVMVAARVCNYGDSVETFEVEAIIDTSGTALYGDTVTVADLGTAQCDTVTFASWVVPDTHDVTYTVTVVTLLQTDINPGNDTTWKLTVGWCPTGIEELVTIPVMPSSYSLGQSRPNPATGWVTIDYQLPVKSQVSLRVYDLKGTLVSTLVEGVQEAGFSTVSWDGRDERGMPVASGIYFYKLTALPEEERAAEKLTAVRKLILLK